MAHPMTPQEYRLALETTRMTQVEAAVLLGVDERTSRRWALGERTIPSSVAILLRLVVHRPELRPVMQIVADQPLVHRASSEEVTA